LLLPLSPSGHVSPRVVDPSPIVESDSVESEDIKSLRNTLTILRKKFDKIKAAQLNERHRLTVHQATNEGSQGRMAMISLFETLVFILVSGGQVFIMKKWFEKRVGVLPGGGGSAWA